MEEIFSYQLSFTDIEADKYIEYRRSHADPRIHAMDRLTDEVVDELVKLCLPFYHKKKGLAVQAGRPYMRLEMMVRLHLLQISLNYSDLLMEVYLTSDVAARRFCQVPSGRTTVSDTSLLRFRRFIERHGIAEKFLARTVHIAEDMGAFSLESVAADGTFIDAPDSTKNQAHARDPEMASGKKGNTWHFGMKEHIAASLNSGVVYSVAAGPANEHDITRLADILSGGEQNIFLDSGYLGCHKREEVLALPFEKKVSWFVADKPSAWKKQLAIGEAIEGKVGEAIKGMVAVKRQFEHAKASARCAIEWTFHWIKNIYGYSKTRYRGIAKNHSRTVMLCSLYNWYRMGKWRARQLQPQPC